MENYMIIKKIGSGSFATVYLAKKDQELYALKVINKTEITAVYEQKLNNEIKILRKLNHQNIVKLYDVIETEDSYYLILEYISGGDLYDLVTSQDFSKLQINDKKRIFNQISKAVQYLHENHICHADLKLENILIDKNRNIKLTDFNLAYEFKDGERNNLRCGSLEYAAPEIILGKLHYPCPSDVWALGVILYILQYGEFPFQQTPGKSPYSLYMKIAQAKYEFPDVDIDSIINSNSVIYNNSINKKTKDLHSFSSFGNLKMSPLRPLTDLNDNNGLQASPFKSSDFRSSADTLNYNQYGSIDNIEIINKLKNEASGNDHESGIENAKTLEAIDCYDDYTDYSVYMDESEIDSSEINDFNEKEDTKSKSLLKPSNVLRKSRSLNSKAIRDYNEKLIRNDLDELKDLIQKILKPDQNKRATLTDILKHPWMSNELQLRKRFYL
ncbi:Pkinase-domain-containing protein [Neocallimastix lanati (nom. inval.)]|jgi:serine/threonine protein kinase|uniref:Pkinase-domain-containing protein n=1 Tax=Neocallimastix californiae TaxID=1754190 RepID=A0A1Y2CMY0_9FUNG|nr:Pkinase-domain-containing protein [Neocallimastix sp. JGI-2020a]ORY48362.1 Pkinase-domain-containing protein [Neocallimastix californiae]|eukprot:ORY48362.1 Pkinase-domain-containing protein [Neocallimastix californiae]